MYSWPPFIPPENPEHVDADLHFFDAVCDELTQQYNIDERRVYATGMSQGAAFVNLLVAETASGRRDSCRAQDSDAIYRRLR